MHKFTSVKDALRFLANDFRDQVSERKELRFESRHLILDRARYLFQLLGAPQKNKKTIHIAGTSGKGSSAIILSQLLSAHGFKVGTLISPHIVRYNERFLINGIEIDNEQLLHYVNTILPMSERMAETSFGKPHFLTICTAIGYQYFHDEKVDYSVIETKAGGLYDVTNTESNPEKVSLITELGFDHEKMLGNTLSSIAYHKAGIMSDYGYCFALWGEDETNEVLEDTAYARNNKLSWIKPVKNYDVISLRADKTVFSYHSDTLNLTNLEISLLGEHQVRNACLALRALEYIAQRDGWKIDEEKIRASLLEMKRFIAGRIEHRKIKNHECYFDVAHNAQKVKALVDTLQKIHPKQKFTFVISFKGTKDFQKIIDILVPIATRFIITAFIKENVGVPFEATATQSIADYLKQAYPKFKSIVIATTSKALEQALKEKEPIVVTGSFYLLSEILQTSKEVS